MEGKKIFLMAGKEGHLSRMRIIVWAWANFPIEVAGTKFIAENCGGAGVRLRK